MKAGMMALEMPLKVREGEENKKIGAIAFVKDDFRWWHMTERGRGTIRCCGREITSNMKGKAMMREKIIQKQLFYTLSTC